jgi:hypothetical protein
VDALGLELQIGEHDDRKRDATVDLDQLLDAYERP